MFGVSNIAAKQRAIQLGLDTAAGTHIYIDWTLSFAIYV
jgi:hypothetical protein